MHYQDERLTGPNWGLIGAILFCLAFWGGVYHLIFH